MWHPPVPDLSLSSIFELTPELLQKLGLRLLLLDLDNTISLYRLAEPTQELAVWLESVKNAGVEPFIFSNSRGARPEIFSRKLGIGFIGKANKPNPHKLLELLEKKGVGRHESALVGDQVFTDVFCARRAGVLAVAVRPMSLKMPHRALRYALESPFRLAGRIRQGRGV